MNQNSGGGWMPDNAGGYNPPYQDQNAYGGGMPQQQ